MEEKKDVKPIAKIGAVIAVIVLGALIYFGAGELAVGPVTPDSPLRFLINESVSASAPLVVRIPDGVPEVTASQASRAISFEPAVRGSWSAGKEPRELIFKPAGKLTLNKRYQINVALAATATSAASSSSPASLSTDFLVAPDPEVLAIFPRSDSEANEASEESAITIVFNRPMVPVTTLDELDTKSLPVTISPETKGVWKWTSTRNLQFVPAERLVRSSHYKINVQSGFRSVEGLAVPAFAHQFTTRPLRLSHVSNGQLVYNQPIRVAFNQPIDLARTAKEISLTRSDGKVVEVVVEYAKTSGEEDKSTLVIYPKEDSHGRERLWDLQTSYVAYIKMAYPSEGDINIEGGIRVSVNTTDIIASLGVTSERSALVSQELFDPAGEVEVAFFEEINLGASSIEAKGIAAITHGEKCAEPDEGGYDVSDCPKVEDKTKIIISWKQGGFALGEKVPLVFKRIVNSAGVTVNYTPIQRELRVYPALVISKVISEGDRGGASLTTLGICSNSPLASVSKENWRDSIVTEGYVAFNYWSEPVRASETYPPERCLPGEYYSEIRYGLVPETNYSIRLVLKDQFGQGAERSLAFKTEKPLAFYTRLGSLQPYYSVTSPDKTKLTYYAENLGYVDVNICRVSPETMLSVLSNSPDGKAGSLNNLGCLNSYSKRVELPKRYWVNNYFQINVSEYTGSALGHYVVSIGNPSYKDAYNNSLAYERTLLSVTRLAVGEKRLNWRPVTYDYDYGAEERGKIEFEKELVAEAENLYWVSRFGTLEPVVGAAVSLYKRETDSPMTLAATGLTAPDGVAKIKPTPKFVGAIVREGQDSAIVSTWTDNFNYYTQSANNSSRTYVYTDRPIYRPGDTVYIRGIDRIGYDGSYMIHREKDVPLRVYNSQGEVVLERSLPISAYGTFNAEFSLPAGAPLGNYRVESFGWSHGFFEVEEYVPAAFELSVTSDKEEYLSGETAKIESEAKYYFGVPLDGGEVEYTITAQDYHFDRYQDEYFSFGSGWYYCYSCGYGDRFLKRGKATMDSNGHAVVNEKLDLDAFYQGDENVGSKVFNVTLTAKDSTGRSVSASRSFIVHRGQYYLGLKTEPYYAGKGQNFDLRLKSVDLMGKPVAVRGGEIMINKIEWKTFKRREVDGRFYYRSEESRAKVKTLPFSADGDGNFQVGLELAQEGEYEFVARVEDGLGNNITAKTRMYIWGEGNVEVRQTNNETLEIEVDKTNFRVGERANIVIKSPYDRARALVTVERGEVYDYKIVEVNSNLFAHQVPIEAEYVPNVYVSAMLISPDPEVKLGQLALSVERKTKELTITTKTNKSAYLPGETVEMDIVAKNWKGEGVSAEVSVAVVDMSVLALSGNPKKDPGLFFYDGFPLTVVSASNVKNILHEADIPTGTKGGSGGGGEDLATKMRGIFKDTAFWRANVVTDKSGKAHVSFKLPDNLTTWQVEALGVTADTLLGVDYTQFTSRKDLSLVAIKPRFVVPGDTFKIGAKVFNETSSRQSLELSLKSKTLSIANGKAKLSVGPGETETVYLDVGAPADMRDGAHEFTLGAVGEGYNDTVLHSIVIGKNETPEVFATAGQSKGNIYEYVYVPKGVVTGTGELEISAEATLARFMTEALEYMLGFPYGCSEQVASQLSSIATVKRALSLPNVDKSLLSKKFEYDDKSYGLNEVVEIALNKVYQAQTPGGGFAYWKGLGPNLHLSLHVTRALIDLRQAGYKIDERVLSNAATYIEGSAWTDEGAYLAKDTVISIAELLGRMGRGGSYRSRALGYIYNRKYTQEDISSEALATLALLVRNEGVTVREIVWKVLENRIDIDGRGSYLPSGKNTYWQYYETPVKNTALLLEALSQAKRETGVNDKIIRWLLRSRNHDGGWGTTNNTLAVLRAFTDYLEWQRETESDFVLDISYDNAKKASFDVNSKTVFEDFRYELPIGDIDPGVLHSVGFDKTNRNSLGNNYYYNLVLRYFLPTENIAARDEGFTVTRGYYTHDDEKFEKELGEAKIGDVIKGHLQITVPKERNLVAIESPIPAGFELVNFNLATERKPEEFQPEATQPREDVYEYYTDEEGNYDYGYKEESDKPQTIYPDHLELRDDRLFMFAEHLNPGVYTYDYYLRALVPGNFQELPARAFEFYTPENFGRTKGSIFKVNEL
jgi:uncharacterized protein YfaS (alpha-2-macroglobulin family)